MLPAVLFLFLQRAAANDVISVNCGFDLYFMFLRFCFAPLGDFEVHFLVDHTPYAIHNSVDRIMYAKNLQTPREDKWLSGKSAALLHLYKHLVLIYFEGAISVASATLSLLCTSCHSDCGSPYACLL